MIAAAVVLIAAGVFFLARGSRPGDQATGSQTPTVSPQVSESVSPSATLAPGKTATPRPTTSTLTYSQAINLYVGKRIQFDQLCKASPANSTFKNGVNIMFDNRSGDARTITIDGKAYSFAGYGWRIIYLSSKTLPHTVKMNCGSTTNVGQIILQ